MMRRPRRPTVWLAGLLGLASLGCTAAHPPGMFTIQTHDIVYRTVSKQRLTMTVCWPTHPADDGAPPRPAAPAEAGGVRRPMVVLLHGGAFNYGTRRQMLGVAEQLARFGFVAATADYRLAPDFPFPAAVQDSFAAVRFVRSEAGRFGGDPDRVAVVGASAGATLAMMVGYCDDPDTRFGDCGDRQTSPRVQAVVNLYGPCDLAHNFDKAQWWVKPLVRRYLGGGLDEVPQRWAAASPIHCIDAGDPPTLTIHGKHDRIVGFGQARLLDEALRRAGVPHVLVPVEAGHAWAYRFGGRESLELMPLLTTFLDATLGSPLATKIRRAR